LLLLLPVITFTLMLMPACRAGKERVTIGLSWCTKNSNLIFQRFYWDINIFYYWGHLVPPSSESKKIFNCQI
jgi:hypothetical protein